MSRPSITERFWKFVSTEPMSGCWLWLGSIQNCGYGQFGIGDKVFLAHRVSYRLFVGIVPRGMELDHLCRIKCCVNPAHLEPVTHKVNSQRALPTVTKCPRGHAYSPENTYFNKGCRGRQCRICNSYSLRKKLKQTGGTI